MRHFVNKAAKHQHASSIVNFSVVNNAGIFGRLSCRATRSPFCFVTGDFGRRDDTQNVLFVSQRRQARQQKSCAEVAAIDTAIQDRRTHSESLLAQSLRQLSITPGTLRHAVLNQQLGLHSPFSKNLRLRRHRRGLGVERKRASLACEHLLKFVLPASGLYELESILTHLVSSCLYVSPNCLEATFNA